MSDPDESELNDALALIRAGDQKAARSLLEASNATDCRVRLRELLVGEGDYQSAAAVAADLAGKDGIEAHVSRAFLLVLRGDLQGALKECAVAARIDEKNGAVHNHAGRILHNAGQSDKALNAFRHALEVQPEYPEAWHNLGHVLRALGNLPEACNAYEKALELSPGYRSARLNLGKTLFNRDEVPAALHAFEQLLVQYDDDIEALTDGGLALHLLGRHDEARTWYDRALAIDDGNAQTWVYLAVLLNELQDADGALSALETATRLAPDNAEAWIELAGTYELLNRLDDARQAVEQGRRIAGELPALKLEDARLKRRAGDFAGAVAVLQSMQADDLPARLRRPYYFELGSSLDRQELTADAYSAFLAGNALGAQDVRRRQLDPGRYLGNCQQLLSHAVDVPVVSTVAGDTGADLCFLHGFTRSGTTLLDMMLDIHPGVEVLEEVPTFEAVLREFSAQSDYPADVPSLDDESIVRLRGLYRAAVQDHLGETEERLIVDKMPMRFVHTGLINRLFPDSRILFSLRHPCDVVLSNFMQQYPSTSDFLANFDTLHDSAVVYDRSMSVWHALEPNLGLPVEYVRYEELVVDSETAIRSVCRFLGIEMTEDMLDTSTRMAGRDRVITPSYQQVVEPMYRRAVARWQRYREYLEPELELLRPHMEKLGY